MEQSSSIFVSAFEAGYIWDTKAASDAAPNIRKPKKGTRYDDLMNAFEYGIIGEGIPIAPSAQMLALAQARHQAAPEREVLAAQTAEARQVRLSQRDHDPADKDFDRGARSRRGML